MNSTFATVTSGFGTILAAEFELQEIVRSRLNAEAGNANAGVARILEEHLVQLGTVVTLLQQREQLLPHSDRFEAQSECDRPLAHPVEEASRPAEFSLVDLVTRHQRLRRNIEALIELPGHLEDSERHLREAAQRHGEMEWMLNALLNEDATQRRTSPPAEIPPAEKVWENEGGQNAVSVVPFPNTAGLNGT